VSPYLDPDIPVVAIYNNLEAIYKFLIQAEAETVFTEKYYRGDRSLLWLGDSKLVFVTTAVPHAGYLRRRLGYQNTHYLSPATPSLWLSLDILKEPKLLAALVEHAGPQRVAQIVPYETTLQFLQLVDVLRQKHNLTVLLPESPSPKNLWIRDYVDTKAGFRVLASHWLARAADLLPEGVICQTLPEAASVVYWFIANKRACLVKTNRGESSLGHCIIKPGEFETTQQILAALEQNRFLRHDLIIVEEFIHSPQLISPSLEFFVPPIAQGPPEITYLSNQLFPEFGNFSGVLISRDLLKEKWYPTLAENGLLLAQKLQQMGYVGHFDLDTIVDEQERVFLLEINARRTAGTHAHEFARLHFGPNYLDDTVILSHSSIPSGAITNFQSLLEAIKDFLYPINQQRKGVVIARSSVLVTGKFDCLIVGASTAEVVDLQNRLIERLLTDLGDQS
jgi:hypothetical protein